MIQTLTTFTPRISSRTAFYIALIGVVGMFAMYVGFVNKTIMNVVAREHARKEVASISTSIGSLEFKYITLKNNVTLQLAHERGFEDASPRSFLTREKFVPALSINNPR